MLAAVAGISPLVIAAVFAGKAVGDSIFYRAFAGRWLTLREMCLMPLKELLLIGVWAQGLFRREVVWRGRHLRVGRQSVYSKAA